MFSRTTFGVSAFGVAIAAGLWSSAPAVSGEVPLQNEGTSRYLPIQSISYEFGSKAMRGYFVQRGSVCLVTLMIIEKNDPDRPSPSTATRVRLIMDRARSQASIVRRAARSTLPVVKMPRCSSLTTARDPSFWRNRVLR
jgi:hypothetical protein